MNQEIINNIQLLIKNDFDKIEPKIQEWTRKRLITPRKITASNDPDGKTKSDYWLITDNISQNDSSYRVVFDERTNNFGLLCALDNGIEWYMGSYGSFSESINNM